jgi:Uma2 family endonuclease
MNIQAPHRMTVDEYLAWAVRQDGRWELIDGRPVKMPAETLGHIRVKHYVARALEDVIDSSGLELHALSDGATVRIDDSNANEPDSLVYAGAELPDSNLEVPNPVIVVEVVSPSSGRRDRVHKRQDYFSLPSVEHYLVVDPETRTLLHFHRGNWQGEGTEMTEADTARLDPPGIALPVRRCFARR